MQQLRNAFNQLCLLHLVGNLGDHDLIGATPRVLLLPFGAQPEAAAARFVGLPDLIARLDQNATGGKVRSRDEFNELVDRGTGILDQVQKRVAKLLGVVRRNVRRHPHRDTNRTIRQQVRKCGRQYHRLVTRPIIGRAKRNRVLVDALQQRLRHVRQPAFGVAHGRSVIAIDVAEVALTIDKRVAHGEPLRQPHQRVVNCLVAVRVEVAHHLADDLCALFVAGGRIEFKLAHGIENAPVHRLEAVAHVGQRAMHDGGERVCEVALFQRILEVDRLNRAWTRQNRFIAHDIGLPRAPCSGKGRVAHAQGAKL